MDELSTSSRGTSDATSRGSNQTSVGGVGAATDPLLQNAEPGSAFETTTDVSGSVTLTASATTTGPAPATSAPISALSSPSSRRSAGAEAGPTGQTAGSTNRGSEGPNPGPEASSVEAAASALPTRDELNIFERFMDVFTGNRNGNRSSSTGNAAGSTTATTTTTTVDTDPNGAIDSNAGGAIIITVSYVFSDENNPLSPNRTGSLVMSLPNTPANRDPSTIQEIISLAARMAYSSILDGFQKTQKTSLDKFNSFPTKALAGLETCSICFEEYEEPDANDEASHEEAAKKRESDEDDDEKPKRKRRKVDPGHFADHSHANASLGTSRAPATENATSSAESIAQPSNAVVQYLADYSGEFKHFPIEMPCGHVFGKSCLFEWLKNNTTCPLCRDSVSEPQEPEATANTDNREPLTRVQSELASETSGTYASIPTRTRIYRNVTDHTNLTRLNPGTLRHNPPSIDSTRLIPRPPSGSSSLDTGSETGSGTGREDNGVLSQLLAFLRRPNPAPENLFPSGVSSRRTPTGVITRLSDNIDTNAILDYLNLRSLTDDAGGDNEASEAETATSATPATTTTAPGPESAAGAQDNETNDNDTTNES